MMVWCTSKWCLVRFVDTLVWICCFVRNGLLFDMWWTPIHLLINRILIENIARILCFCMPNLTSLRSWIKLTITIEILKLKEIEMICNEVYGASNVFISLHWDWQARQRSRDLPSIQACTTPSGHELTATSAMRLLPRQTVRLPHLLLNYTLHLDFLTSLIRKVWSCSLCTCRFVSHFYMGLRLHTFAGSLPWKRGVQLWAAPTWILRCVFRNAWLSHHD